MKISFIVLILGGLVAALYFLGAFAFLEPEKNYSDYYGNNCIDGRYNTGESVTVITKQGENCKIEIRSRQGPGINGVTAVECTLPIEKIPLLKAENSTATAAYAQYCREFKE